MIIWNKLGIKGDVFISEDNKYIVKKEAEEEYISAYLNIHKEGDNPEIGGLAGYLCEECFQIFSKDKLVKRTKDGIDKYFCKKCRIKIFTICKECGEIKTKEQTTYSAIEKKRYCQKCWKTKFFYCNKCKKEFLISKRKEVGDRNYCESCYNETFATCNECGTVFYKTELRLIGGVLYCDRCYRNHAIIKDYTYIPNKFIYFSNKWDDNLYLGIELEVEVKNMDTSLNELWAKDLETFLKLNGLDKYFYFKHDGTIKGFEIVSHPFTLSFAHKYMKFETLLKWLSKNQFTSYISGNCGLHVHINRDFFNSLDIQKIRMFFKVNQEEIKIFSKRDNYNFCKIETYSPKDFLFSGLHQRDKYWAVRTEPHHKNTIELRIFRGTLFYPRFIAVIQFSDAVARYIKEVGTCSLLKKQWGDFIKWVEEKGHYTHFLEYLEKENHKVHKEKCEI